jgi:hypothetical protein
VLPAGETTPQTNWGETDAGLDLTGATKLVFSAKAIGESQHVEFFVGGLGWEGPRKVAIHPDSINKVASLIRLSDTWDEYTIDLDGMDLSRVACGFGWVTSRDTNPRRDEVNFLIDDIRFVFDQPRLKPILLPSYAPAAPGTDEAIINSFAYTYDNAAAAIALVNAGHKDPAQQIGDALIYALNHDRTFTDGRLRNAYSNGDPSSFPGWFSSQGTPFARLPGFYDPTTAQWGEDFYAVSSATGNMAWAMIALCTLHSHLTHRSDYLEAAQRIGDFVLSLRSGDGFTGGYEGWEGNQVKNTYKSTEHNIDLISAYAMLHVLTGDEKYLEASNSAKAFVLSMYDEQRHVFYTGTTDDGVTVNMEVLPLDTNTWALLALGDSFGDGPQVMDFVEANMAFDEGYGFWTKTNGVWMEGTAQVALVYHQLGEVEKYESIMAYLSTQQLDDGSIVAADREGVTTGFMVSGTEIPWVYGKRAHVGATAWLAFAQQGLNPFAWG